MTTVPQKYTVHCLIDQTCDCAPKNEYIKYYMFMEGSLDVSALQYCIQEPTLSCSEAANNSSDMPIVDYQLTVTWNAESVIKQGDYTYTNTPANGDHDFLCAATYVSALNEAVMAYEFAFVSVRGT